ncbi:nucleoside recognition domain-containing protein [Palleronia sp. LCG004]|uniref:nucleoside recognition domain-containing protein n=1 Tax=Palleronia sp. LCG004 TaxID=3079304 RepID=UPI002942BAD0|nr:nucleoside recognition domain-containing protein [Palleronia sp. LCG004]WOI56817.1 nucleoside recognition domain-containing protein [Palleronia sp. LCG004]
MAPIRFVLRNTRETVEMYWILARIMVPVVLATELLKDLGALEIVAPAFGPVMALVGLPPELGLAWLTGLLVGIWGALPIIFALVPVDALTAADMTIFSSLLLIAHGLPIEQRIVAKAGPAFFVTALARALGGLLYAWLLHVILSATGWLSRPLDPAWVPMGGGAEGWGAILAGLLETLVVMFGVLWLLCIGLDLLKQSGILDLLVRGMAPILRLAGMSREAGPLAAIGLFLGISYGGAFLIREARSGTIPPREVFLTCIFMGFAHSIIEDTLVVMALGADAMGVLVGRLAFAIAMTALTAWILGRLPERVFLGWIFRDPGPAAAGPEGARG